MKSLMILFLLVNLYGWAVQTVLDIKIKHIQPIIAVPSVVSVMLVWNQTTLWSFTPLLIAPILYQTEKIGIGDTTLYIMYIFSTIINPIQGIINLMTITGLYLLITQEIFHKTEVPLAPAGFISLIITYSTTF